MTAYENVVLKVQDLEKKIENINKILLDTLVEVQAHRILFQGQANWNNDRFPKWRKETREAVDTILGLASTQEMVMKSGKEALVELRRKLFEIIGGNENEVIAPRSLGLRRRFLNWLQGA